MSDVWLTSSSGNNNTDDNFTLNSIVVDIDNDIVYNITDWMINGVSDMVLNMPFENTTNNTEAKDYSSYQNNGNIVGAVCNSTNGLIGQGCDFSNDVINLGYTSSLNITSAITLSAWVKRDVDTNAWGAIVSKWNGGLSKRSYGIYVSNTGFWAFHLSSTGGDNINVQSNDQALADGWHHILGVYDGTNMNLYIDGVNQTDSDTISGIYGIDQDLEIGSFSSGDFDGQIDEVKIWNRSLSDSEILAIYNNESILHSDAVDFYGVGATVKANVTINDLIDNRGNLETEEVTIQSVTPPEDTCTYTSGDWNVDCSDNCVISEVVNLDGNDISIVGTGTFTLNADIKNFVILHRAGVCTITQDGGYFKW